MIPPDCVARAIERLTKLERMWTERATFADGADHASAEVEATVWRAAARDLRKQRARIEGQVARLPSANVIVSLKMDPYEPVGDISITVVRRGVAETVLLVADITAHDEEWTIHPAALLRALLT